MLSRRNKKKKAIDKTLTEVAKGTHVLAVGRQRMSQEDLDRPGISELKKGRLQSEKERLELSERRFNYLLGRIKSNKEIKPHMMAWL